MRASALALSCLSSAFSLISCCQLLINPGPHYVLAPGLCSVHAGFDPFANQVTLQLGHGSDDRKHDLAHRAVGVDLVLDADNADARLIEILEHSHQMGHAPGEAVELPDERHIELVIAVYEAEHPKSVSFSWKSRL